jgi:hypothetical protein
MLQLACPVCHGFGGMAMPPDAAMEPVLEAPYRRHAYVDGYARADMSHGCQSALTDAAAVTPPVRSTARDIADPAASHRSRRGVSGLTPGNRRAVGTV